MVFIDENKQTLRLLQLNFSVGQVSNVVEMPPLPSSQLGYYPARTPVPPGLPAMNRPDSHGKLQKPVVRRSTASLV